MKYFLRFLQSLIFTSDYTEEHRLGTEEPLPQS